MSKTNRQTAALLSALSVLVLVSCDQRPQPEVYDTDVRVSAPTGVNVVAQPTSLKVSWSPVNEVAQYGYNLYAQDGSVAKEGTTIDTTVSITGLKLFTPYTLELVSIPFLGQGGPARGLPIAVQTTFYTRISQLEGTYQTYLLKADGDSWSATLNEDRSYEGYQEGWFGRFTLSKFFNRESASLQFEVNEDNSIRLLNATGYDAEGWAMVSTGYSVPASRKVLYIDEANAKFDIAGRTLTYPSRLNGEPNTDTFAW